MFIHNDDEQQDTIDSQDELSWYLQDLATMPVLSLKEEREVVQQLATDLHSASADAARKLLIEGNLQLVVRLAKRYQHFGPELPDLVQEGNIALIKAAQRFDPNRSQVFRVFARRCICWALYGIAKEHLHENHFMEADSEPIYPLSAQMLKALAHNTIDEQAKVFDLPEERFLSLALLLEDEESEALHEERSSLHSYHILEGEALEPDEVYDAQEFAMCIADCLQTLTVKERFVLVHRFLLSAPQTLERLGRMIGDSRERARQLEERALRKMRHPQNARKLHIFLS